MANIDLEKNITSLNIGAQLPNYTGVSIKVGQDGAGNEVTYNAGNDSGYVLKIENPVGTRAMANNILADLTARGVRYQPYTANGAVLDPAAEIGDGVTANGTSSYIANLSRNFGRLMKADISAPYDEEINHEYTYESQSEREFLRESAYTRSRIALNENSILAEVERANEAEGTLSSRLQLTADAITSEVTRATSAENVLSSRITQTAESITTVVAGVIDKYDTTGLTVDYYGFGHPTDAGFDPAEYSGATYLNQDNGYLYLSNGATWVKQAELPTITDELRTSINQRLDSITLTASSSGGTSTFTIKDGETIIDTQTLDLSVKAVNIEGKLTVGQIEDGSFLISSQTVTEYYLSSSSTALSGGQWTATIPAWKADKYIWTRQATTNTYNDNSTQTVYSNPVYDQNLTTAKSEVADSERRSQTIYKCVGTGSSPGQPPTTTWVTSTADTTNTWTTVRPKNRQGYAIYLCVQRESMLGKITCTTPQLDNTTTVIDGNNIITGSISADKLNVGDLSAFGATIGGWDIDSDQIKKTVKNGNVTYGMYLSAPKNATAANNAIVVYGGSTMLFAVSYAGFLYAKNAQIEGTITATAGTIGGVSISNGILTGIRSTNIAQGGVSGGEYGNVASSALTGYNMSNGINASLGYAQGYGYAIQSGTGTYPPQFSCGRLIATRGMSLLGWDLSTQSISYTDGNGNVQTKTFVTAQR